MKLVEISKKIFHSLLFILIFIVVSSCDNSVEPIDKNLNVDIYNKEFEIGMLSPDGWNQIRLQNTLDFVEYVWDHNIYKNGKASVSLEIRHDHDKIQAAYFWFTTVINFEIGKTYNYSCWIKTENLNQTPFIFVTCLDKDNMSTSYSTTESKYTITGTNDWTYVESSITVNDNTQIIYIGGGIYRPYNIGGKIWLDSFSISEN